MKSSTHPALLYSARILAMLWAAFWTWFGLASGIAEGLGPAGILVHTAVPGLFFVLLLLVAWRWQAVGGILLVLASLSIAVAYPLVFRRMPLPTTIFVLLTMAVPPLLAGILFLAHWRLNKSKLT
jgi:hypothetical protein